MHYLFTIVVCNLNMMFSNLIRILNCRCLTYGKPAQLAVISDHDAHNAVYNLAGMLARPCSFVRRSDQV